MKVIGITGPTGSGKTTVLQVLSDLGSVILDCDVIYHELTERSQAMRMELVCRFGGEIFDENGVLQRKKLGAIVFDHETALADLNEITHRYVYQAVERAICEAEQDKRTAVAIDAIALLESGLGNLCDVTVAVVADDELRVRRIMVRDGIDETYARKRVAAQKPSSWFEERCDYTLHNNGDTPAELKRGAYELFQNLINTYR